MQPAIQTGIEAWVSRRSMLVTGLAAWTGAFILAMAAGWYSLRVDARTHATGTHATGETVGSTATAPAPEEATEPEVLPADAIVAPRPSAGVTQMQKP